MYVWSHLAILHVTVIYYILLYINNIVIYIDYSIEDPLGGITAGPPLWDPDPTENSIRKALRFIEKPSKNHARRLPRLPETIKTYVHVANQFSKSKKGAASKLFYAFLQVWVHFLVPGRGPKISEKS